MSKPQLTSSMLGTLARCGIIFQRRFGERFGCWDREEIIPSSIAITTGIAVHSSVQHHMTLKRDYPTKSHLVLDECTQWASDEFEKVWSNGILLTADEAATVKQTKGAAKDMAANLAGLHYSQIAPGIEPTAVEEPFVITLKDYPIDLAGRIDIREKQVIRDTKTARATPKQDDARSLQMAMYSLAHKVLFGKMPLTVNLDYLVKTKTPKAVTIAAVPKEEWIDPLMRRIENATTIIEAVREGKGAFTPCDPNHWQCSERYCGYAKTCKFWSGK